MNEVEVIIPTTIMGGDVPAGGQEGQVLTKTGSGEERVVRK